ncbi:MAG: hypothetical protein JW876_00920 [Candidatus Krumholzibacteriota bacterium]|nr:hypothetical protein [Candidatus Krumholzibacteriota bacterium]
MTKRSTMRIAAAIAAAALAVAAAGRGASDPRLSIEPLRATIGPGERCTLTVSVDAAVDSLSCVECLLAWDAAVIRCVEAAEGSLYAGAGFPTFFDWTQETDDTASAADCVLGYRSFVIAPGALLRYVFEGIADGACAVSIAGSRLWDIDRTELQHLRGEPAFVSVGDAAGETAPRVRARLWNRPNPFNPSTTFSLFVPGEAGDAAGVSFTLTIYDVRGRPVRALASGRIHPGVHEFPWDGRNGAGVRVDAGVYFAVARAPELELRRKVVMVR